MKIALLSGANSIHTIRWANGLSSAGHEVHVISQHTAVSPFLPTVTVHQFPFRGVLGYFLMKPAVCKLLQVIKPDIVNAHYASGYGTTARLVNYSPWVLSVWGSDVYDFPYKSLLHKWGVVSNLEAADAVASTSHCMAAQTRKLAPKLGDIAITPFGVDCDQFSPQPIQLLLHSTQEPYQPIVIGTVKTMAHKYGIDILIKAFALSQRALAKTHADLAARLRLRIVGGGSDEVALKALAKQQQISEAVMFVGSVPHRDVPNELRKLDIFVALSRNESFGVAAIEASAVGLPVVVSDEGGLAEVILQGKTGLIVPKDNPQAAADALVRLILNPTLRRELGRAGRVHVLDNYSWDTSLKKMLAVYESLINQCK